MYLIVIRKSRWGGVPEIVSWMNRLIYMSFKSIKSTDAGTESFKRRL